MAKGAEPRRVMPERAGDSREGGRRVRGTLGWTALALLLLLSIHHVILPEAPVSDEGACPLCLLVSALGLFLPALIRTRARTTLARVLFFEYPHFSDPGIWSSWMRRGPPSLAFSDCRSLANL
jgi:hypothetical protein